MRPVANLILIMVAKAIILFSLIPIVDDQLHGRHVWSPVLWTLVVIFVVAQIRTIMLAFEIAEKFTHSNSPS